jgi:hypothetical protein
MPQLPLQTIKRYDGHIGGNFTDSDHLASAYDSSKPYVLETALAQIYSSTDRFHGKPLLGMTMAKGKTVEVDTDTYRWYLEGAEYKCLRSVENLERSAGNYTPGKNKTTFKIKIDEGWYQRPDVVFPEDNDYPIQIVEGPIQDGTGYIYVCQLETDDYDKSLPLDYMDEGKEFSKVWTTVQNEMNTDYGTQSYRGMFELESQIGHFAQKITVTDKAFRRDGKFGIPFSYKGKKVEKFIPMAQAKMDDTFYMSMEAQWWFGEKFTGNGSDGYIKRQAPGLRQLLRDGWIEYYNGPLTEQMLKEYLMDIFFSREDENNRKVTLMTGTMGSIMFHDLLAASASSFLTVDTHYVEKMGDRRHLSYGAQFTHYVGPEGIEVTVVKNPLYDSRKYCKRMHPIHTDKPIDSWRMTVLDFGTSGGDDNIKVIKEADTFTYGYHSGIIDKNGKPVQGGHVSTMDRGVTYFISGSGSIHMTDPTRGGELILDFDY